MTEIFKHKPHVIEPESIVVTSVTRSDTETKEAHMVMNVGHIPASLILIYDTAAEMDKLIMALTECRQVVFGHE